MLHEQLLKRIKALIALSIDNSTTDAERKLALSHAARLMARHSVDLSAAEEPQVLVEDYKSTLRPFGLDQHTEHLIYYTITIQFGCYISYNAHTETYKIYGFKTNIEITLYTIEVLIGQGRRDCSAARLMNKTAGFAIEFWHGFHSGIFERFSKVEHSTESIVLYDKVKELFESKSIAYHKRITFGSNAAGFQQGQTSAKEASIHKPLHETIGRKGIA